MTSRIGWALLVLAACETNPGGAGAAAPSASSAAPSASTAAPAQSADGSSYKDEELPVPGDFEKEAESLVTDDNYKEKLAELQAQVGGEPAPSASAAPSAAPSSAPQ